MGSERGRGRAPEASARLGLRVSPGGARSEVIGRHGEVWKVRVVARAERGRANDAVLDLLADVLGVPRRRVTLVAGMTGRDKVIEVAGMTNEEADRLIESRRRKGTP